MLFLTVWPDVSESLFLKWWGRGGWWVSYLCQIEWAGSPVLPGGKALLLGDMAHIFTFVLPWQGGQVNLPWYPWQDTVSKWERSLHEAELHSHPLCPCTSYFLLLTHSLFHSALLHSLSCCLSVVVLSWLHFVSSENSYFCSMCSLQSIY